MNSIKRELDNAQAKVDSAVAKVHALEAEMLLLNRQEKEHSIRYERYLKKAADTERLIQTGQASSYEAAQAQHQQCLDIADKEETRILELMEEMEVCDDGILAAETHLALQRGLHEKKTDERDSQWPGLQKSLQDAEQLRTELAQKVRDDHLRLYEQIRKKLRHAVSTISSDACNSCGLGISSMPLAEHKRGSGVHQCANCGRFLGELI